MLSFGASQWFNVYRTRPRYELAHVAMASTRCTGTLPCKAMYTAFVSTLKWTSRTSVHLALAHDVHELIHTEHATSTDAYAEVVVALAAVTSAATSAACNQAHAQAWRPCASMSSVLTVCPTRESKDPAAA